MIGMFMSGTSDDAANIEAINEYIMAQPIHTTAAGQVRDEWLKWHESIGWTGQNFPSVETYDEARNLRNKFNLANAKTEAEKADIKNVQQTGLSSEQLRGETDRRTVDGNYLVVPPEAEPWIPTKTKIAGALIAVGAGVLWFLKKAYVDPFLPGKK